MLTEFSIDGSSNSDTMKIIFGCKVRFITLFRFEALVGLQLMAAYHGGMLITGKMTGKRYIKFVLISFPLYFNTHISYKWEEGECLVIYKLLSFFLQ
jgi:hypothetical protein